MDTLFRWYVVLGAAPDAGGLKHAAKVMDDWHVRESTFASPGWLVTRNVLRGMARTAHLDTPFFRHCLGDGGSNALWARSHSRYPLWQGHYRLRWNLDPSGVVPPTQEAARASAGRAAADLALSLRFYGLDPWAGDKAYRTFFLLSRVLSLRLFLERGLACDPQDIDALVAAYRDAFPDSRPWLDRVEREVLGLTPAQLGRRGAAELFYRDYPFLRDALRASLDQDR